MHQDKTFATRVAKLQVFLTTFWFVYIFISALFFNKYPAPYSRLVILLCLPGIFLGLGISGLVTGVMVRHAGWSWHFPEKPKSILNYYTGRRAYLLALLWLIIGSIAAWYLLATFFGFKTLIPFS